LVGTDVFRIVDRVSLLLRDKAAYSLHQIDRNPYGDGQAAARIVELMLRQGWQAEAAPGDVAITRAA
jgi:UDP-N-acetylglucosamine 2-epimerase